MSLKPLVGMNYEQRVLTPFYSKYVCPLFFSFDADYLQTCSQRVFFPILKEKEKSFSCIWIY